MGNRQKYFLHCEKQKKIFVEAEENEYSTGKLLPELLVLLLESNDLACMFPKQFVVVSLSYS